MNDIAQKATTEQPVTVAAQGGEKIESANTPSNRLGKTWSFLSGRVLNLVTLTTFFSVAGYFVVHSYLDKLTGIFTYQVDPVVYITAGVNMVLGVVGNIIIRILPTQVSELVLGVLSIFAVFTVAVIIFVVRYQRTKSEERAKEGVDGFLKWLQTVNFYLFLISVAILAALSGFVYGYSGYEYSPHALGGGMPASVVLVFKPQSGIQISDLGLPIEMQPVTVTTGTPAPALRSQPVEMLMELSDGLLVRDPQQGIPVVIKDDMLYAIIDAELPTPVAP